MRTYVIFIGLLAVIGAVALFSTQRTIVKFNKDDATKSIEVQVANLMKKTTQIAIQDMEGKVWFSKYIRNKNGYSMGMSLYGMPESDYVTFVTNREGMWAEAFAMNMEKIQFFDAVPAEVHVAAPVAYTPNADENLIYKITDEGEMSLGVRLANLQEQPAYIRVIAMGKGSIFVRDIKGENGVAFSVNMEGVDTGHYFAYIKTAKTNLIQFFKVSKDDIMLGKMQILEHEKMAPAADEVVTSK